MSTAPVAATIQAILDARAEPAPTFIATRYPFTYAYDFVRMHAVEFGFAAEDERRNHRSSKMIREYADRTGQDYVTVLIACADAYLAYYGIAVTDDAKNAALAYQRMHAWKSLDLPGPVLPSPQER